MPRTLRLAVPVSIMLLVAACASTPITELRVGVRSAAFIQYGAEPLEYSLGVVDGKSFWAVGARQNITVPVPGISAAQAASATSALHVGAAVAEQQIKNEAELIPEMFRNMLNKRPIVSEIAQGVLPSVAETWGVTYRREQLRVVSGRSTLQNQQGVFTWDDPKTDIVIVFFVSRLKLTEKPSMGGLFAAVGTLGFNDKNVAPEFMNVVQVFKRDPVDQKLKHIWNGSCSSYVLNMPVTRKFSELRASPNNGKAMFDAAVNVTSEMCRRQLAQQSS